MHPNVHSSTVYNSQDMKQPTCSSTDNWIKMWYINTMDYQSEKKDEILLLATMQTDPENTVLSEMSDRDRQRLHDITYIWNLENNTNECICKTETDSQIQKTHSWLPKGRRARVRTNQENGINRLKTTIYKIDKQQRYTMEHRE